MKVLALLASVLLTACTAVVSSQLEALETLEKVATLEPPPPPVEIATEGSTFLAKFATNAALNSKSSFVSDYHGEVRITLYPNRTMDCRWWAEGRVTDPTIYEGVNGFLKAFSTLCAGKLQRNGSFDYQGAYLSEGPEHDEQSDPEDATFTIRGSAEGDTIVGELILGGMYGKSDVLVDQEERIDSQEGISFEAILIDQ